MGLDSLDDSTGLSPTLRILEFSNGYSQGIRGEKPAYLDLFADFHLSSLYDSLLSYWRSYVTRCLQLVLYFALLELGAEKGSMEWKMMYLKHVFWLSI
jgi:hypothetical protein